MGDIAIFSLSHGTVQRRDRRYCTMGKMEEGNTLTDKIWTAVIILYVFFHNQLKLAFCWVYLTSFCRRNISGTRQNVLTSREWEWCALPDVVAAPAYLGLSSLLEEVEQRVLFGYRRARQSRFWCIGLVLAPDSVGQTGNKKTAHAKTKPTQITKHFSLT